MEATYRIGLAGQAKLTWTEGPDAYSGVSNRRGGGNRRGGVHSGQFSIEGGVLIEGGVFTSASF